MCNLYSITRSQDAMRGLFDVARDIAGNLPPQPDVFPDQLAPIVRVADGKRQLETMRWGMPGPPQFGGAPVTNIRNTASPHWRAWLGPDHRCLVPVNSFCEWADTKPKKTPTCFALADDRPLFAFAGIWTTWRGVHGPKTTLSRASTSFTAFSPPQRTASLVRCTRKLCRCFSPRPTIGTCGSVHLGARRQRCSGRCRIT